MPFKFEHLETWRRALLLVDRIYEVSGTLPGHEKHNLTSQMRRAATSIALDIAEGSTGQTDAEQARYVGMALRSLHETVACLHIVRRRGYLSDKDFDDPYEMADQLVAKLHAMRRRLSPTRSWVREESVRYRAESAEPRNDE